MNKITTINGIFLANQNDVNEHFENAAVHVTQEEKTAWNDKADRTSFAAHEINTVVHVTKEEREKWNRSLEVDADDNLSLPGSLTAQGGTFSDAVHADGGIIIPIPPVSDVGAVRKVDLTSPLFPMLPSQQENGVGFYHKLGSAFTAGGVTVCTSEDFPFIMSEHRMIGPGDDNIHAWYHSTFVLELNTLVNPSGVDVANSDNSKFGVRANFGPCLRPWFSVSWLPWPPAEWPYRQNDYVDPLIYSEAENGRDHPVASVWPGNTGSDFLPRCGFQSSQRAGYVRSNSHYLYAVYDSHQTARLIVFREEHSHMNGRKRLYLFSQDRAGAIKLIGAVKSSYSFSYHVLSMSRHGVSGVAGWWAERGDPFGLLSKIKESWTGGQRPMDDCPWPIRQSLFDVPAEGGVVDIELTCDNKTHICISCPDWITWEDGAGDSEQWQLVAAPNETGISRNGLVNVQLYNGITYTIMINQQN